MVSMDQTDRDYPGGVCDDGICAAGGTPFLYWICSGICAVSAAKMDPAQDASETGTGGICRDD